MSPLKSFFWLISKGLLELNQNKWLYLAKVGKLASIAIIGSSLVIVFVGTLMHPEPNEMWERVYYGVIAAIIFAAGAYLACAFESSEKRILFNKLKTINEKKV